MWGKWKKVEVDLKGMRELEPVTLRDQAVVAASFGGCGRVCQLFTQVQSDQWETGAGLAFGTWSWSICTEMEMKSYGLAESSLKKDGDLNLRCVLTYVVGEWIFPDTPHVQSLLPLCPLLVNADLGAPPQNSKAGSRSSPFSPPTQPMPHTQGLHAGKEWMWVLRVTKSKHGRGHKKKYRANSVQVRHWKKCSLTKERMFPLLISERGIQEVGVKCDLHTQRLWVWGHRRKRCKILRLPPL